MNSSLQIPLQTPLDSPVQSPILRQLQAENSDLKAEVVNLKKQLDWLKRQLFGQKRERFEAPPEQMAFADLFDARPAPADEPQYQDIPAHKRREKSQQTEDETALFFDDNVPVETIHLLSQEAQGVDPQSYEVISEKVTYKLAQRPGAFVILKYVRPVIKFKQTGQIASAPAPAGVLGNSRADVSFLAGALTDKFLYHAPLYRQHQRLDQCGIHVTRPWLTQVTQAALELLSPVYESQMDSICSSRVIAMDETPIKAGLSEGGKMKTGYFWPIYGEQDEVGFPFFPNRQHGNVGQILHRKQAHPPPDRVILSDGYEAYKKYAHTMGLTHAQCWSHSRRKFFESLEVEKTLASQALTLIGEIYAVEDAIRDQALQGADKRAYRQRHALPLVDQFFRWVHDKLNGHGFLPSNPVTKALNYVRERETGLRVFLTDPEVAVDTNHLERALRVIPMGKRAWLFSWTEVGAQHVGIIQSLIVTCRLHSIDPYEYLVDVLQRVGEHPASRVHELTPRLWKQHFADNPLRSPLHKFDQQ
ncbi:IS66 family transposase [Ferrovum sp.]|uniref:IS66 family transposase n=1 Tax=Ferrovum sp. TaxID=2609467 RepID=UPI00344E54E1